MAPPSHRRPSPAQNLKSVISAAALAATLSGWAILANTEPPEPLVASAVPAQSEILQPIPTLVPLVEVRPHSVQSQPTPMATQPSPLVSRPAPQLRQSAPIISTRSSR
jgi:hypothetical protein